MTRLPSAWRYTRWLPLLRTYAKPSDSKYSFPEKGDHIIDGKFRASKLCGARESSAATRAGLIELTEAIRTQCLGPAVTRCLELGPGQSRLRARLFDLRAVRAERVDESGGWTLEVELTTSQWQELCMQEGLTDECFQREM